MSGRVARRARGLRGRLARTFGLFSFFITLLFGVLVWGSVMLSEDMIMTRILELEIEDYLQQRAEDPAAPLPQSRWLSSTFDASALPDSLRSFADSPDGFYEHKQDRFSPSYQDLVLHLAIRTLEDGDRLYFYLDSSQVEAIDASLWMLTWSLLLGIGVMTVLGMALGRATADRSIRPLIELARRVEGVDPAHPTPVSEGFEDDEVGLLARALDESMMRSSAFLERERRFTRDASHELRSPLTVVRGAVELLEAAPEAQRKGLQRPIQRIRRACDAMTRLIEAFLWLAREEALAEGLKACSPAHEMREAVARHRHLLENKPVDVEISVDEDAVVHAPEGILAVIFGNLTANAFQFTQQGAVRLRFVQDVFEIADTGPGLAEGELAVALEAHHRGERSSGFGLGLAIVHDLCERFGWRLELTSREGDGFQARIDFAPGGDRP